MSFRIQIHTQHTYIINMMMALHLRSGYHRKKLTVVTFNSLTLNAWRSTMRVFAAPIERLNAKYLMKIETVIKTQYYFWTPNQKIRSAAAKNASGSKL